MTDSKKVYIVNLSCLHKLHKIETKGFAAFANLYEHSYSYHFLSYLAYACNLIQVGAIYYSKRHIINDYKLGKITTETFIEEMLNAFSFLKNKDDGKQSLIDAWNKIIDFDEEHDLRARALFHEATIEGAQVFLISNTNELNADKILHHFRDNMPAAWDDSPDISCTLSQEPVKLAPDVYFCPSYRFATFKSGTPGLLRSLVESLDIQKEDITVISQFPGDSEAAEELGIHAEKDEDFFSSLTTQIGNRPN